MTPVARVLHLALPWAMSWRSARGVGDPAASLELYDRGTSLLSGLAPGAPLPVRAACAAGGLGASLLPPAHPVRVAAVAGAEELIWRGRCEGRRAGVAAVAGFALLHAPAEPRRWPYHLLTGTVLTAVRSRLGLGAACGAHLAHNLWVARRAAPAAAPGPAQSAEADLPAASSW